MVFTGLNILYYLLNRKREEATYLDQSKFINGQYLVKENTNSLRNFSFIVFELNENEIIENPLYFIKQVKSFDKINLLDIDSEARALFLFNGNSMSEFVPKLLDSDFYNGCLITEHIDGKDLRDFSINFSSIGYNEKTEKKWEKIFSELSKILAVLHQQSTKINFPEFTPGIFKLEVEFLTNIAKIQEKKQGFVLNRNLPNNNITDLLSQIVPLLKKINYTKDALIHRDAHFKNFITDADNKEPENLTVKLVDWELTSIGDKYWDIAKIYSSLLEIYGSYDYEDKSDFFKALILILWNNYHKNLNIEKTNEAALKVVNFVLIDILEVELSNMMNEESLQETKIREIYDALSNPKNWKWKNINLYETLTSSKL